jgi:undecaprenyl-diphosphatase
MVGGFTFFFVGDVAGHGGPTGLDRTAADLADRLETGALVDAAKLLTNLGSSPVIIAVALATAVWAAMRRRWPDAAALVAGVALSILLVHLTKAAYDRPRPTGGLVQADLSAYPSGHATYAVTWVACATVLVRAGTRWAVRFAAVTVAIAIVAVVGATRVYLRVHHLTDVIGGIALGVAIWALVGAIALVSGHVRQNGRGTR